MTITHEEKLAMARECQREAYRMAEDDVTTFRDYGVQSALLAIDRMQERVRAEGQAEGFAAAVQQLRDMRGQKPQPPYAWVAEMLANMLEESRIPCAAIRETPPDNPPGPPSPPVPPPSRVA